MTDEKQGGEGRKLGDMLAPGSDWRDRPAARRLPPVADAWFNRPYDKIIWDMARRHGEDPESVLREFHGSGPLARTLRKFLGLADMPEKIRIWRMRLSWDPAVMSRADHDAAIAAYLNSETDPSGKKRRMVSPDSIRKMGEEGARMLKAEVRARIGESGTLADLFKVEPREPES